MSEPPKPRTTCVADWKHEVIIVPFWWVCTTSNEDEANMVEKTVKDVERKLVFTVLVNNRPLQPTEKLTMYRHKLVKAPLSSAASSSAKKQKVG